MAQMTKEEFWKNFNIGREVQLSGNFIYDGLLVFEQMEHFYNEDEIFEFFYFISVGIERLLKANVVLIEHSFDSVQSELENSLRTHNHTELKNRIEEKHNLHLGKVHNEFLQILTKFYKTTRYDRFSIYNYQHYDKEKDVLISFLKKYLAREIHTNFLNPTANDIKIKKFIGRVIGKIISSLYDILHEESHRLNIYSYEIRTFSKAYKIFLEKDFTFEREKILQKEILVYLLQNTEDSGFKEHIKKHLPPLEFLNGSENTYTKCLLDLSKCSEFLDELEARYDDLEDKKQRFAAIAVIGNDNLIFRKDMADEEE
ncbi:hypothetical protein [Marivirga sp.]|uniref:hypothetical protein n=1 Tax=Marivirga sp. TaxID=2018662 RepID=UPI0025D3FDA1|nr:hypothetical protein [Marivirga sp.]